MTDKKNGMIIWIHHTKKVIRCKFFRFNGKKEGEYKEYDCDGQLRNIYNYKNGKLEGEHREYYPNGRLYKICNYKNNQKEGKYEEYDKNLQIYKLYNFIKGTIVYNFVIDD